MAARTERQRRLLDELAARGFVAVAELSGDLGVSEVTVRADLAALEGEGALRRVHGGAVPARVESPIERTMGQASEVKRAIGERAAALVQPGASVLLDVGSTALAAAEALAAREDLHDVTVITNGLTIALALEPAVPRLTVVVTGGTLRPLQHSLVEPHALAGLADLHADLALLGASALDTAGASNVNLAEAQLKRRMVDASARRVLLADGAKLGLRHLAPVAALDELDLLITGGEPDAVQVAALEAAGLEVDVVG